MRSGWKALGNIALALPLLAGTCLAQDAAAAPKIDTGDTAWLLISTALVMLMTPGLAFFYGGLVRRKSVLSIMMQCMIAVSIVSVLWVLFGYSLAFGPDKGGLIGDLSWLGLRGVGEAPNADYAATIPHSLFMAFQMMFAIITPALILGAFAERMKFGAYCAFIVLWSTLVYCPVAHWVWGVGGFLRKMGALDFAGGTVVHINAGIAALVCALMLGKRIGYPDRISPPHNLPFAVLGAALLWFGWFGFNAGSALASNGLASSAFIATHIAAATAGLVWAVLDRFFASRSTVLGFITGAVAGLVAITPAAGFVTVLGALAIGILAALVCYGSVAFMKVRLGYDDSLDAFGVHGVGGILGALATGLFATKAVNAAGADGLFYGNPAQFVIQLKATAITLVYSLVVTFVLLKVLDKVMGLRVGDHEERVGLDLTQHKEAAYTTLD